MYSGVLTRILVTLVLAATWVSCTPSYVRLTRQGDVLLKRESVEEAEAKYQKAVKKSAKYAPALEKLGYIRLGENDWEGAVKYYSSAIAADPQMGSALWGRGIALFRLGQWDAASQDLLRAQTLGIPRAHLGVGVFFYLKGEYAAALAALSQASQVEEDAFEAAWYTFKSTLASNDLKTGRAILGAMKPFVTPERRFRGPDIQDDSEYTEAEDLEDEEALEKEQTWLKRDGANRLRHLLIDLAYLDGDFPAAHAEASRLNDLLSLGIWFRDGAGAGRGSGSQFRGAIVEYVELGSPAAQAGILPSDVITSFERKAIQSAADLEGELEAFRKKQTHDEALVEVLRTHQQIAFRLIPGSFRTRELIEQAAQGAERVNLSMAPDALLRFP